jgi:amino acid transporter
VAEFTKAEPSAGSFITYVETALGARAGVATALLVTVGYTVAIASVFTMSGGQGRDGIDQRLLEAGVLPAGAGGA